MIPLGFQIIAVFLKDIQLLNFKNYEERHFDFSQSVNCFVGSNGTGKTNVLEAIHYLSATRGYFNPIDSQNVKHGTEFFMISGVFETDMGEDRIQCSVKKGVKKKFSKNKKDYSRLADHFGRYPAVVIAPNDTDLIREGSEYRRKFIDAAISQFDRAYLEHLVQYTKVLQQRNQLLKSAKHPREVDLESLSVWDAQLIHIGEKIYNRRKSFIEPFTPGFLEMYQRISGGEEHVSLVYKSQYEEEDFEALFESAREKDLILRRSTVGCHKDDLSFEIHGHPLKKFGSQGQQKSFLIALKLALFQYIQKETGAKPMLLLDDIFDKIDDHRVAALMQLVSEHAFGQIFISDTHEKRVPELFENAGEDVKVFNIAKANKTESQDA